jgi:hypothetical protein
MILTVRNKKRKKEMAAEYKKKQQTIPIELFLLIDC